MAESYPLHPYLDGHIFTTSAGTEYFLLFRSEGHLFPEVPALHDNIFSVLFFPLSASQHTGSNERIMVTIVEAVRRKLETATDVVIYIVDDSDGREAAREKRFERLYFQQAQTEIEAVTGAIQKTDRSVASVLLIHKDNRWKAAVVARFFTLLAELGKD